MLKKRGENKMSLTAFSPHIYHSPHRLLLRVAPQQSPVIPQRISSITTGAPSIKLHLDNKL